MMHVVHSHVQCGMSKPVVACAGGGWGSTREVLSPGAEKILGFDMCGPRGTRAGRTSVLLRENR